MLYEDFLIIGSNEQPRADIEVKNDNISREINNEYVLTFTAPWQELKTDYLEETGAKIIADDQMFDIKYYEQSHDITGKVEYTVEAWHVMYRLRKKLFENFVMSGTPAQILASILSGTDFSVGTVDFTTQVVFTVNEPMNGLQLLTTFALYINAEIDYSNFGFDVDLLNTIGQDNGFEISFGNNLKGIRKRVDSRLGGSPITSYEVNLIELKNSVEYIKKGYRDLEVIGIGDTVKIIDPVTGISTSQRIKKINYSPRYRKNTTLEIADVIKVFTDSVTEIKMQTVTKGKTYNGITISSEEGYVAERSDGKAKVSMNATEGISIYSDVGSGLVRNFYVDTDGKIKAKEIDIDGAGTFRGTVTVTRLDEKAKVVIDTTNGIEIYGDVEGVLEKLFYVDSNGKIKAKQIDIDGSGTFSGKITGAVIRTAASGKRIVIENNSLKTYNADGKLEGLSYGEGVGASFGDQYYYSNDVLAMMIYNTISDGFAIIPVGTFKVQLGAPEKTVIMSGTVDCSNAIYPSLSDGTYDYMKNNDVSGSFVADGKTITVVNGRVTSITN